MSLYEEIGNSIVAARKEKGFTQERLALEANVSPAYLRLIEKGSANPTIKELNRVVTPMGIALTNPVAFSAVM